MKPNPKEDFQYNSCVSRGICSINPRITALQTVIILYLRFFARFLSHIKTTFEVRQFILNTLVISLYNPDFNEDSFLFALKKIKEILPEIMDKNFEENTGIKFVPVKEVQGHKPLEVVIGAVLGISIGIAFSIF